MKTLNSSISKSGQSASYKATIEHNCHKLQITIKSDSYRSQSFARIKRWSGEEWKMLDFIPSADMQTPTDLAYINSALNVGHFTADIKALKSGAKDIL